MKNKINLIIITIIFIIFSIVFYGKTGNMLIDFSRESYIPFQINNGSVLIKDIFLIYGFWGYFVNSLLYKLSVNINLLLIEAIILSYAISVLFYFIVKKFLNHTLALIFTLFFISVSVFSNSTFSFVLPYSYSTLWSIFGIYLVLFGLLYKKNGLVFLSLGLILISKIEYFIPTLIAVIFYQIYKKEGFLKQSFLLLIFPSISLFYFLIKGITLNDLIYNLTIIKTMINTDAIKHLYNHMGCFLSLETFKLRFSYLVKFLPIILISYFLFIKKFKITSLIILIITLSSIALNFSLNLISIISIFLTIILYSKRKITAKELLLFAFCLILCSKALFSMNPFTYSNFGYALFIAYTYKQFAKFLNKHWLFYSLILFLICINLKNITNYIKNPKEKFKTEVGTIYLASNDKKLFENINEYFKTNLKKEQSLLVVPEGQIFNLINKKDWQYYNSTFTPLDFETFKEEELIKKLKDNKTDYILYYPRNTKDYGKPTICYDYGVDFCTFVMDNYTRIAIFEEGFKALLFKLNE